MTWDLTALAASAAAHPAYAAVSAAAALTAAFMLWRAARRLASGARTALRGQQSEDVLTVVAAGLATAVAMTGMWRFFGTVLHFSGPERAAMFAFLEVAVVTSAFRARRNVRDLGSAGAEGAAVWILSALSAVLSALDARSGAEAVFRLAAPLVAAWLWERSLTSERRRATGRAVHWRLTADRILVWLRLAEPGQRDVSEVDAHRRIGRVARAAKQLRDRRAAGSASCRQRYALRRLDKAMAAAVEHAALAANPARQDQLRDQIGALTAAESLASLPAAAPWDRRAAEAAVLGRQRRQAQDEIREAITTARQEAEARARASAESADRAQREAARVAEAITEQLHALEQSGASLLARAETAERELGLTRAWATELSEALAQAEAPAPDVDREALVAELAGEIRTAAAAGDMWRPDYDALMARTGRQRRWCEYLTRDARSAVFSDTAAAPVPEPARAESRAGHLTHLNGASR